MASASALHPWRLVPAALVWVTATTEEVTPALHTTTLAGGRSWTTPAPDGATTESASASVSSSMGTSSRRPPANAMQFDLAVPHWEGDTSTSTTSLGAGASSSSAFLGTSRAPPSAHLDQEAPSTSKMRSVATQEQVTQLSVIADGEHPVIKTCSGTEKEIAPCTNLPACSSSCEPLDCAFNDWGDWHQLGGCSGLCTRDRTIKTFSNGCGQPCTGSRRETLRRDDCLPDSCKANTTDCIWNDWSDWAACAQGQQYRFRDVGMTAVSFGKACTGPANQTRPCDEFTPQDCELTDWAEWGECSTICGGGMRSRVRRINIHRQLGGKACDASLTEMQACNEDSCSADEQCQFSDWGDWQGCSSSSQQMTRERTIVPTAGVLLGMCNILDAQILQEVQPCRFDDDAAHRCDLSDWGEWSSCSSSCDGQQSRSREVLGSESEQLTCAFDRSQAQALVESRPCGSSTCSHVSTECQLSDWEDWAPCSQPCGHGVTERSRFTLAHGATCSAPLKEVSDCTLGECTMADCELSSWEMWGSCSCKCGGGTRERKRDVSQPPRQGGKACEAGGMAEIEPCNTQPCNRTCIDGAWGAWSDWSACSGTCLPAFMVRRREIEQHANECGRPAAGLEDDYRLCEQLDQCVPDQDCELHDWSDWSPCSGTCHGVRERHRDVKTFQSGDGIKCNNRSLQEMSPCNPAMGEESPDGCRQERHRCQLAAWASWTDCSQSCGGGQMHRSRFVLVPNEQGAEPCEDSLLETKACADTPCNQGECIDCEWDQWSDWGDCLKCGDQKYRHRSIKHVPNFCGKPCDGPSKEAASCESPCDKLYCTWEEWADMGDCSATCGQATKMRTRQLAMHKEKPTNLSSIFFKASDHILTCTGIQTSQDRCKLPACGDECMPIDCLLSDWKEWSAPSFEQLCERTRDVQRTANCGGEVCSGSLTETKRCNASGFQDCLLSDWSAWEPDGPCWAPHQRSRKRTVLQQPLGGGGPCQGALRETDVCAGQLEKEEKSDCALGDWDDWSSCSATCGDGVRSRARTESQLAAGGGTLCEGRLTEVEKCVASCSSSSCSLSDWSEWGACSGQTRQRDRTVLQEAIGEGEMCADHLVEIVGCESGASHCQLSDWSGWSPCDRTCDGQQDRVRRILDEIASWGEECQDAIHETRGCSEGHCDFSDCQLSDWEDWGECSVVHCGQGYRQRVKQVLPGSVGGRGCAGNLEELDVCAVDANGSDGDCSPPQDCVWGDWESWSECSCSCGGGSHQRTREVLRWPKGGGKACEALSSEEARSCNNQPCGGEQCLDGEWEDWSQWAPCSATCEGITWRNRKLKREADPCGKSVSGNSMEHASCNADVRCDGEAKVDCRLTQWSDWTECDVTFCGMARRHRSIEAQRRAGGAPCNGSLEQARPCVGGPCTTLEHDEDRDCVVDDWGDWGVCDQLCHGQRSRSRDVLETPSGNGKPCEQDISVTEECSMDDLLQDGSCNKTVDADCKWGAWGDWGACSGCDGERQRSRHVEVLSAGRGKPCEPGDSEEISNCTRHCHYVPGTFCGWLDWGPWSTCSTSCDEGSRSRSRDLGMLRFGSSDNLGTPSNRSSSKEQYSQKYVTLLAHEATLRDRRLPELMAAFVGGCLCVLVILPGARACSRHHCLQRQRAALYESVFNNASAPVSRVMEVVAHEQWDSRPSPRRSRYLALSTEDDDERIVLGPAE